MLIDRRTIRKGLSVIAANDCDVAQALKRVGYPEPRIRPVGFKALLSIIVSQQISTGAAQSIMGRVRDLLPEISAPATLALSDGALRKAGLSGRKVEYVNSLAQAIVTGQFDPIALEQQADSQVIASICMLRGLGRWSAEVYLMFSLQRPDVFPAGDLALQRALQKLKGWDNRPSADETRAAVAHWMPWRTVGSLFLWHFYRGAPT
jgi:DNA-3-methyladenine glycosylase II